MPSKISKALDTQGHRKRVKERFAAGNGESFSDYELLELCLFYAIPRRDVKKLAKSLIAHFGSFSALISAPLEQLTAFDGLSDNTALYLKLLYHSSLKHIHNTFEDSPILHTWDRLIDYCFAKLAHKKHEELHAFFLNHRHVLIKNECLQSGTINVASIYPREIIRRALDLGASSFILVHNHPSGDLTPSDNDINITTHIAEIAKGLNILLLDHLIISRNGISSLKNLGFLE